MIFAPILNMPRYPYINFFFKFVQTFAAKHTYTQLCFTQTNPHDLCCYFGKLKKHEQSYLSEKKIAVYFNHVGYCTQTADLNHFSMAGT